MKPQNPQIICADGTKLSVQAGQYYYCEPRSDDGPYSLVEVGYPTAAPTGELSRYAENPSALTDTVYGYVPVAVVADFIQSHGGIKKGKMP